MKSASVESVSLPSLHQRRIAVEIAVLGHERRVVGRGIYEKDAELGQVLRITFPSKTDGELVVSEKDWNGEIFPSEEPDCDFVVRLMAPL